MHARNKTFSQHGLVCAVLCVHAAMVIERCDICMLQVTESCMGVAY